jgi:hypothetical protein
MSAEDGATGPEAAQARMRGERWIDSVGVSYLSQAIDSFLNDFLVNKCIRTPKDVKASAKDLASFNDWLFTHSFTSPELHASTAKQCGSSGKAIKKRASEPTLSASMVAGIPQMTPMPNGLVRMPSNPQARAEGAGKILSGSALMRRISQLLHGSNTDQFLQSNTASLPVTNTKALDRNRESLLSTGTSSLTVCGQRMSS